MWLMHVVIMGVAGSGKTTVGLRLAHDLKAQFQDGDELHSEAAIAKMSAGIPLTDEDRWPWLDAVATWLAEQERGIIACSALRRVYRDCIRDVAGDDVVFVHLTAPQAVLEKRMSQRVGHFFHKDGLLDSQYAALEPLESDEVGGSVGVHNYTPEGVALVGRSIIETAGR